MNKKQRKKLTEQKVKIESAHDILEGVREEIEEIFGEEQEKFDNLPEERLGHKVESKGFLDAVTVRDFPLRDKRVNFKVRRRKWYDHTTGEYFTNTYDTVYKGTRYSKEFAAFLKALPGDISPIGPFA